MKFRRASILFTEDDADTRELISLLLSKEGFNVVSTQDQSQALTLARQKKFDLYLLDSWMPGLSGFELCSELREFDSETPILFYSGAGFDADKARALECGAQGYLVKPVEPHLLIEEIRRLIAAKTGDIRLVL